MTCLPALEPRNLTWVACLATSYNWQPNGPPRFGVGLARQSGADTQPLGGPLKDRNERVCGGPSLRVRTAFILARLCCMVQPLPIGKAHEHSITARVPCCSSSPIPRPESVVLDQLKVAAIPACGIGMLALPADARSNLHNLPTSPPSHVSKPLRCLALNFGQPPPCHFPSVETRDHR